MRLVAPPKARTLALLAAVAAVLTASIGASAAHASGPAESSCFWLGPYSTEVPSALGEDGSTILFPDENATYWLARYDTLPAGSTLTLTREYAHARHESLNAYQTIVTPAGPRRGFPSDAVADFQINPDPGSTNPYVAGNVRNDPRRSYTVTVAATDPPATREPNTLYTGKGTNGPSEIMLRVYVPDPGKGRLGGTALPEPHLRLADGTTLEGQALCDAINDPERTKPPPLLTQPQWEGALASALGGGGYNLANCPETRPAPATPIWNNFFNTNNTLAVVQHCGSDPAPTASPPVQGGFYSTIHNSYIYTFVNRQFGKIVVFHGKAPSFRDTSSPGQTVPSAPTQTRYWSFCTGEGFSTTRTPHGGCAADYTVPLDKDGYYTIVMSRAEDRPTNAKPNCGVAWINWGDNGDGTFDAYGNLRNPDYGDVIYRQLLADGSFTQAIKNIKKNADVESTMGDYYPQPEYVATKNAFEARGCK